MERRVNIFLGGSIISQWNTAYILPNCQNINLGLSKMTANDLLRNYSNVIININNKENIQNIILYVGSNDVTTNKEKEGKIVGNIIDFIKFLQKTINNTNIIFIAILKSPNRKPNEIKKIDYINQKMREFINHNNNNNLYFCNFNRQLRSLENYQSDKTHLSEIGYFNLTRSLQEILK